MTKNRSSFFSGKNRGDTRQLPPPTLVTPLYMLYYASSQRSNIEGHSGDTMTFKEDVVQRSGWLTVGGLAIPLDIQSPWETPLSLISWSNCWNTVLELPPVCIHLLLCDVM